MSIFKRKKVEPIHIEYVIKRDGSFEEFDINKIKSAIHKAFSAKDADALYFIKFWDKFNKDFFIINRETKPHVEHIQNIIEKELSKYDFDIARSYITYRDKHALLREINTTDEAIKTLIEGKNEYWNKENANKRAERTSTQRDYIAGITSTDIAKRLILPKEVVEAHEAGIIHQHDMDYAIHPGITNCCLINLKDMLDNGTVINDVLIESPHRFLTACTIASQIMLNVASNQYGGLTISIAHLAPYLRKSCKYYKSKYKNHWESLFNKELEDGIQTLNYQLNSFTASTGQSPFSTIHIDLEEDLEYKKEIELIATELLKQRIKGFKNKDGVYVTQAFPKIIVVLRDKYFTDPKYKDFIYLCAECTAKRMVPDYISEKNMLKYKGAVIPVMGCRSMLSLLYEDGKLKLWGRLNVGVCSLNLPFIAYESNGDIDKFWDLMVKYTNLCRTAQLTRVKRIANTSVDCAPTLWMHGAFARLHEGSKIGDIIYNGYASISLGYAGLYECTKIMTGESHSSAKGYDFAKGVMEFLANKTEQWKLEDNLGWSVYGTPIESVTYKFAKALHKFGYDRDFVTNSVHIPVFEDIDPIEKLKIEGSLQKYSTGGNVNYVESSDMTNNLDAIIEIMKAINEYCLYAEINSKHDYCHNCGSEVEQQVDEDMNWYCPSCGCKDPKKLFHARRICG